MTHYDTLGLGREASERDIVHAYRALIRRWHPDVAGPAGAAKTAAINEAYDTLRDPAARRDYDRALDPLPPVNEPSSSAPAARRPKGEPPTLPPFWSSLRPRPRLLLPLGILGLLLAAGGVVAVAAPADEPTYAGLGAAFMMTVVAGAVLAFTPAHARIRPLFDLRARVVGAVALAFPLAAAIASIFSPVISELVAPTTIWGSATAAAGVALLAYTFGRVALHRTERRDALLGRDLLTLMDAGEHVYWVVRALDLDGTGMTEVLLQHIDADAPNVRTTLWEPATPGTWVALNAAGHVLAVAPAEAFTAWEKYRPE